jgi:hypothetical protein
VPGGNGGVLLENTAQGTKLHYYASGLQGSRREYHVVTRELKVYLTTSPSWTLHDRSGKTLYGRPESLAFSSNGQWMVVDSPFVATLQVNLITGEAVPFSNPYNYNAGLSVTPHLAVSDDGATVAMASDRGDVKVVAIEGCAAVPATINSPVACPFTTHDAYLRSQIAGLYRIYQLRFLNNHRLQFYARYNTSPATQALARYHMAPAGVSIE